MINLAAVALGGALGALMRYGVVAYLFPVLPNRFPIGTLTANVIGSCLIGVFYVVIMQKQWLGPEWRFFIITGLLGAFTTFSTFSLESVQLWQYGHMALALGYIVLSLLLCLAGTALSMYLAAQFLK